MAGSDNIQPLPRPTVVGIGASAGGIQALSVFLDALPPNTGAAFVVTIHLDPHHKSELPNVLAAHTTLPVAVVDAPVSLEANHVYVVPPDRQLAITDNTISALPFEEPRGHRTPIDSFFRSLAAKRGDGFAVILTGGGSDGALSMKAVKEAGGIILVQDPAEAEHASMPNAAIATDVVDFVLPVRQIAERLAELISSKN